MTLVIGGKNYVLDNDEWMFPTDKGALAQTQQQLKKKFAPLGPQLMTQVSDDIPAQPEAQSTIQIENEVVGHSGQNCKSTIMAMDIARQMFLVGDVFMRRYYTIFDRESDRVGLATAVTNEKVKALSSQ